ncbi:hypothetical protein ACIQLK_05680 [Microbacterium sp. NPDC091382]|uniref:hypothetical protein n=1 Tax=Microbacterium sp. NPDC091382 TaxID=3364210 RepID=UPI00381BE50C
MTREYTPTFAENEWRQLKPFVSDVASRVAEHVRYPEAAILHSVAHHAHWAHLVAGMPLRAEVLFSRDVIAYSVSMIPTSRPSTMARHRSILLRVGEALGIIDTDRPLPRLRAADPSAPYSAAQIQELRTWATLQRDPASRRSAHALITLGIGAGLPTRDLSRVRAADIDLDFSHLTVISGNSPRTVRVAREWTEDLRAVARRAEHWDASLFRPGIEFHKNVVHTFVQRSVAQEIGPTTQRMRATWLVRNLSVGVPMQDLLHWAGLKSMDALVRYQQFLPAPETADARDTPASTADSPCPTPGSTLRP